MKDLCRHGFLLRYKSSFISPMNFISSCVAHVFQTACNSRRRVNCSMYNVHGSLYPIWTDWMGYCDCFVTGITCWVLGITWVLICDSSDIITEGYWDSKANSHGSDKPSLWWLVVAKILLIERYATQMCYHSLFRCTQTQWIGDQHLAAPGPTSSGKPLVVGQSHTIVFLGVATTLSEI